MIYKSNMDEVLGRLKKEFSPTNMDKMVREIAMNVYASNLRRVHNEGKAVSGNIGKYSTKPLYVNPAKAGVRQFSKKGKTGKTVFKNGKPHKTGYFSGYGSFKSAIGFSTTVNMEVTGRLRADWVILRSGSTYQIGFQSSYGKKISEGNEDHFGKQIWGVTDDDRRINTQIINRYLAKLK